MESADPSVRLLGNPEIWSQLEFPVSFGSTRTDCRASASYSFAKKFNPKSAPPDEKLGLLICEQGRADESFLLARAELVVVCAKAEEVFEQLVSPLVAPKWTETGAPAAIDAKNLIMEPNVIVGPDCIFGEDVILETGVRLGARVRIGAGTRLEAGVRVADDCTVGSHCTVKAYAVIGGTGFGLIGSGARQRLRTHLGTVRIGDHTNVGSHVAIDSGVIDDTVIGSWVHIDNLVQIAHNTVVGDGAVVCALVGLGGSTVLGERVVLAGMVGTAGHLKIGDGTVVAAQSGVNADLEAGLFVKGYPPRPMTEFLKIQSLVGRLPELYDRLKRLEEAEADDIE